MLVLSRKKNEGIVINKDIVITVIEMRGDKVRLGIVAPKDVGVHREEVWAQIHGTTFVLPTTADAGGVTPAVAEPTEPTEPEPPVKEEKKAKTKAKPGATPGTRKRTRRPNN